MSDILSEAADIVSGKRKQEYGDPEENFYRVAQLWTAYLAGRGLIDLDRTDGIMPTDYAWMQALVKIARLEHGYHHDSVVDLAGYAACAAQINEPPLTFTAARCTTYMANRGRCTLTALHSGDHVYEPVVPHGLCGNSGPFFGAPCLLEEGHVGRFGTMHKTSAGVTW